MDETEQEPPRSALAIWLAAARPKTLPAAIAPVLIGCALASEADVFDGGLAVLCVVVALGMQIGTNLANDYYDFLKGADTDARLGPLRVTQAGLLSPAAVRRGFIAAFALAACVGLTQLPRGGWPVAAIVVTSVASGILYTGGPYPLGYHGLGDIFAFLFFGPVAAAGTFYIQALTLTPAALLAGLGPGLFAAALLAVNNLRDIDTDRASGKRTLAVRFGSRFARAEYVSALVLAALVPVLLVLRSGDHYPVLAASAAVCAAVPAARTLCTTSDGPALNRTLAATARVMLLYSLCFAAGWAL
jgi:1,4-dihydroxy-2-naphthoate octaprenyltransferase